MNSKRFYWWAQIFGWLAYCGLITFSVYTNDPSRLNSLFITNIFILVFTGIIGTHLQRVVFIRLGWLELRLPRLLPRIIISSLATSIFIAAIDTLTDYYTGLYNADGKTLEITTVIVSVFAVLILVLAWNAIYFTFHYFQQSRKQEVFNLELKASNRESELKNLRSQLNPHFLFNSLNSIRALVDVEPAKAKISITTLSNLLRQSLVLGKENLVQLESELNLAKSYLELEKIRFEDRLKVEWELTPGLEDFEIPPFSLQMMVENAIKHGISNLKDGGLVKISAYPEGDHVVIQVINTGDLNAVIDLGVGIQNIKKRLALQYGDGAEFLLNDKDGFVTAKMIFKR